MKLIKLIFSLLTLIVIVSCTQCVNNSAQGNKQPENSGLKPFDWLCEHWVEEKGDTVFHEIWTKTNDTVFAGTGCMLVSGDTVFSEKLRLERHSTETYYIPTVDDQNNGNPVFFTLFATGTDTFPFENKAHDYPQKITYVRTDSNHLYVCVDGTDKGVYRKEEFRLKKISK